MWSMRYYTPVKKVIDSEDHPFIRGGELCRCCLSPIQVGDEVTLIPLGPGKNEEERARMNIGITYTALCAIVHWDCAHHDKEPLARTGKYDP